MVDLTAAQMWRRPRQQSQLIILAHDCSLLRIHPTRQRRQSRDPLRTCIRTVTVAGHSFAANCRGLPRTERTGQAEPPSQMTIDPLNA